MGKLNYKNFNFNKKEDYLYGLYLVISAAYQGLKKYKRYIKELSEYQEKIIQENCAYIDADIYQEWMDKHQNTMHSLLKCFVDNTSTGFSYIMFRQMISRSTYAKLLPEQPEYIKKDLEELRDVRNWTFHFAQSDIVANKESFLQSIPEELRKSVTYNLTPIVVDEYSKVSAVYIDSLRYTMEGRLQVFTEVFEQMKKDYEGVLGANVSIVEKPIETLEYNRRELATAQLSMAMQKKKYDGSLKSFEEITMKKFFEDI